MAKTKPQTLVSLNGDILTQGPNDSALFYYLPRPFVPHFLAGLARPHAVVGQAVSALECLLTQPGVTLAPNSFSPVSFTVALPTGFLLAYVEDGSLPAIARNADLIVTPSRSFTLEGPKNLAVRQQLLAAHQVNPDADAIATLIEDAILRMPSKHT